MSFIEFDGDEESSDVEDEEAEEDDDSSSQAVTNSPLHSPKRVTTPSVNTAANGTAVVSTKTSDNFNDAPAAAAAAVDNTLSDKITPDNSNSNSSTQQGQGQGEAKRPGEADDSQKAGSRGDRNKTIRFEGSNPMRDAGEQPVL